MFADKLAAQRDGALLFLRVGLGLMFVLHGWPKLAGGPAKWEALGQAMAVFGITVVPVLWGFMAAFSECIGGVLLALGLLFRPAAGLLAFTMLVAAMRHISRGEGVMSASHAIEDGIVFVTLLLLGPGRFALDTWLEHRLRAARRATPEP
jgi:putative oxidoreductase